MEDEDPAPKYIGWKRPRGKPFAQWQPVFHAKGMKVGEVFELLMEEELKAGDLVPMQFAVMPAGKMPETF